MLARWLAALVLLVAPTALGAQRSTVDAPWALGLRATISGSSHDSDPAGYTVYSGIALDAGLVRRVTNVAAVALSLRTESREVNGPAVAGLRPRLGSLEVIPVDLTLQWRPAGRGGARVQPYLGAGADLTVVWEKSGALDSSDVPARLGPLLQLGTDIGISRRVALDLDARWNPLKLRIQDLAPDEPSVDVDPLTLGVGMEVAF
jgi:outer membrane protein W